MSTVGRKKMTSSDFLLVSLRYLNRLPMDGRLFRPGISSEVLSRLSCIKPPKMAMSPDCTRIMDSISRVCTSGTRLETPALAKSGLGSLT